MDRNYNRLDTTELFGLLENVEEGLLDIELALDRVEFEVSRSYNYDIEVFMGDSYDYYCGLSDLGKIEFILEDFDGFKV